MARILVLDDDSAICEMMHTTLTGDGHEVVTRSDGKAGIDLFRDAPTDLVIVDLLMPRQDGIETIRSLRDIDPSVPILAISGLGSSLRASTNLDAATKLGADASLMKPFGVADLREAIGALLAA